MSGRHRTPRTRLDALLTGKGAAAPRPPHARAQAPTGPAGPARPRRLRDPGAMTPEERLAELGSLLALGYRRHRLSRETGLAETAGAERPCDPVDTQEQQPGGTAA